MRGSGAARIADAALSPSEDSAPRACCPSPSGESWLWRPVSLAVPLAIALAAPPAPAEMFGPDYQPCGDRPNTLAIVECVQAKTREADRRLNTAYETLLSRIVPEQREPLRTAQRLWVWYRDANCAFYGAQEGTIRQVQAAECLRSMTNDRAQELEQAMKFD